MKEKVEKSKLKGMEEELQNTALAPRNTFTSKYCDRCFCHDCVTPNTAEFRLFLVRAFSDDFEHALQKKVPKMLCQYPRKQFRANEDTENSNLKTSLNMQPENAIFQCCFVKVTKNRVDKVLNWSSKKPHCPRGTHFHASDSSKTRQARKSTEKNVFL